MTGLKRHAAWTGKRVSDLKRRRNWLHDDTATRDAALSAVDAKATSRSRRQHRAHLGTYTYRVFAPHDTPPANFDVCWRQPQRIVRRADPRYTLQVRANATT